MYRMGIEQMRKYAASVNVFPYGGYRWTVGVELGVRSVTLTATLPDSRNSRVFDWGDGYLRPGVKTFHQIATKGIPRPNNIPELRHEICVFIAQLAAHEMLEWMYVDGELPHDPHRHGDVTVRIPRRKEDNALRRFSRSVIARLHLGRG